jgi:hypothetical protein
VAGPGSFREKENNACFAADGLILQDVRSLKLRIPDDALKFSQGLYDALLLQPVRGSLDLFAVFAQQFPGLPPQAMFTLLASFTTSGNSGLTGWLQGVEDGLLMADLNNPQLQSLAVYTRSKQLQSAKIMYQKMRTLSDRFEIKLQLFGQDITAWNRHHFMAAFLGCRSTQPMAETVHKVHRIGMGYESKDFVFHLLEGVRMNDARENFKTDSNRYREGATLGYQACH